MKKLVKKLSKIKKKIKKLFKRFKDIKNIKIRINYTNFYEKSLVQSNLVLAQAYGGMNFYGNIYFLLKEMISRKECENFEFYVGARRTEFKSTKKFVENKFGSKVKVVLIGSNKYLKVLASAKYLLNNVGFPTYFIKKDGQIFLNTWHGTPLKGLGRSILDAPNESGNYQRNFLMSDYLLFPNKYTFDCMREDYMLNNLYKGKYVLHGYPRNSIFFDSNLKKDLAKKYNPENNEILIYMPTWRRKNKNEDEEFQITKCIELLNYLEQNLNDKQILYVKLHNLVNNLINFDNFKKIKPFPKDCETYEFLCISDALITDYSSVMFDYMNCNKKIILYTYDLEEYINGRSIYFDIKELPFPLCFTEEEVLNQINNGISNFSDYEKFKQKFCNYDNLNATKNLIDLLLNGDNKNIEIVEGTKYSNNKPNALIYCGDLGFDKFSYNLLNSLQELPSNINFYLNFYNNKVNKNKLVINEIPKEIFYITLQGPRLIKISEAISYRLYYKFNIKSKKVIQSINKMNQREVNRLYPNLNFDYLVVYRYNTRIVNMYSLMNGQKYIFLNKSKISNKKEIKTYKLKINNFDKSFINNTILLEPLKREYDFNGDEEFYCDNLKGFKEFIQNIWR